MNTTKCKAYASFIPDFQSLYGPKHKVYGPYKRKQDGRKIVIIYDGTNRTAKQYAKVKLEIKLERILSKEEEVDHIDGRKRNDKFDNLQLLDRVSNSKKDANHRVHSKVRCAWCKTKFIPRKDQVSSRSKNSAGPFCGKSCSGKYAASIKNGEEELKRKDIKVKYQKGKH